MTITLHKNGIKVTGSTKVQREEILANYGNGLEWKRISSDTFALYGLFGMASIIIEEYNNK